MSDIVKIHEFLLKNRLNSKFLKTFERSHLNPELVDDHPNSNAVTKTNVKLVTTIALILNLVVLVPILKDHTHVAVLLDTLVMVLTRTSTML